MTGGRRSVSRRSFLAASAVALGRPASRVIGAGSATTPERKPAKARIAITLDLEMSRHYPTWDETHWDYEKGNLDADTKRYAVEAARRVKAAGGPIHFFAVGRVFEQENVDWLKEIVAAGHPVGNHTYDHVYVLAAKSEELQFRFQRAPWLIRGKQPRDVIVENIRMTNDAMHTRLGIKPAGFRTPGGFSNGLADRPDVQQIMLDLGFRWVSSKYPAHPNTKPGEPPSSEVYAAIVAAQQQAQPFRYASGLVEVPMSPISDVGAFRSGRWKLDHFLKAIRSAVEWAIEHRAVFDFLGHPSCLTVADPEFKTVEMICELVDAARDAAAIVALDDIAATVPQRVAE